MVWWHWLLIGLALIALEMAASGGFYVIFFGIAALAIGAMHMFGIAGPPWLQFFLFSVLSVASLVFFRSPMLREALFRELTDREYDDLRIDESDLSIQIADGDSYFPIERFSGSEIDLANLALRVAISAHLSRVSGADVGLMVLDEVLGSLDQERKDLMVQAMGRLSARFHQLFVITHAEQVKEQFPASVIVRKVGRRRSVAELL